MIILDWIITEVEAYHWSEWIKEFGSRLNVRMAFGLEKSMQSSIFLQLKSIGYFKNS